MRKIIIAGMFFLTLTHLMSFNLPWARIYGGSDYDWTKSIQQTSDGGYIVAGYTYSFGAGENDCWILKLTSAGNIEWQRTYGRISHDGARSIQQTGDGGYIVAGYTYSFSAGEYDFWILKLDSAGAIQWQCTYGGIEWDIASSIQQTSDGGYIVAGHTYSFGAGQNDFWILKLNSTGTIQWQLTYGGSSWDYAVCIQQTNDGGYIVAGDAYSLGAGGRDIWILKLTSTGNIEWQQIYKEGSTASIQQTTDGGYIVAADTRSFGAGEYDCWILKLDSTGNIEWQRTYGGSNSDHASSIQQTTDGGYIVAAHTTSFGAGASDSWILKLDSTGTIQWQRTYGGIEWDIASSIQQTGDGGYIVAADTASFGAGNKDFWILKLNPEGEIDPSCGFIQSSNAIVSDTYIFPSETSVTPVNTNVTPQSTHISPQDTNVISNLICGGKKKGGGRR